MENKIEENIRLTQYSHGAGCGCKISPAILDKILKGNFAIPDENRLIVGNSTKDDAAVYNLDGKMALISTTDFFMPIVDDPYQFGRIAAANAISDVYAMGGKPIMAIAILGWPINLLSPEIASRVIEGGRSICLEAGIPLAGGHSIDCPEPIFGLAVNGIVDIENVKHNDKAKEGDLLFLTKKVGVGILTTAEKKGILREAHQGLAAAQMMQLNKIGESLGKLSIVHAITDVTGFGLLGHLIEMAEGSGLSAHIDLQAIPWISKALEEYITLGAVPGGTHRNLSSYGAKCFFQTENKHADLLLADPQTSGGLLVAVDPAGVNDFKELLRAGGLEEYGVPIGTLVRKEDSVVYVQ